MSSEGLSRTGTFAAHEVTENRLREPSVRQLGKYSIVSELGRGGTATVHLAFAKGKSGVNKLVVLKGLLPEWAADRDAQARFLDEARLAAQLNHANIVQTYEVGVQGERSVIVMEYLEGHTLNQFVRRAATLGEPLPLAMRLQIIINALEGLHYAHEFKSYDGVALHIVHRDISPQNIFVTFNGQVKVLDFGIAKVASASQQTKYGVLKGKIAYMAPEQIRGGQIDRRADIYAIGSILWGIAAERKLWKDLSEVEILRNVSSGKLPRPEEVNPQVDPELARITMKAMAHHPEDRYANAVELQSDLEQYCSKLGAKVTAKDIGRRISDLYEENRAEMKAQIEREVSRILADESLVQELGAPSADGESISRKIRVGTIPMEEPEPETKPRAKKWWFFAMAGVPVLVLGAWWLSRALGPAPVPAGASQNAAATSSKDRSSAALESSPAPSVAKSSVVVAFRVTPEDAIITVDGRALPPGTTSMSFATDEKVHVLRAEAPGYNPVVRELGVAHDDTIEVHLNKIADSKPRPVTVAPRRAPARTPRAETTSNPNVHLKTGCEEPFFLDSTGIKRVRQECL